MTKQKVIANLSKIKQKKRLVIVIWLFLFKFFEDSTYAGSILQDLSVKREG